MQQLDALKTLEYPAQGGVIGRLAQLVRNRLPRFDQVNKPTNRPTMRWVFQCFEGIELLHIHRLEEVATITLRLQPLHEQILALLGLPYQAIYQLDGT